MRALPGLLLLVACGSKQPAPSPVVASPPASPPAADCRDVGVILRGELEDEDPERGRARERAIEEACRDDRWSQLVIDCIASTPPSRAQACLDQLEPKQRVSWNARMPGDGGQGLLGTTVEIPCPEAIPDAAAFPPSLADNADEREWTRTVRRDFLLEECEHGWDVALKVCLRKAAGDPTTAQECLDAELASDERDELTRKLADFDALAAQIAAAKQKPAKIGCKQVVAHHYGDARWKTKLDGYPAAERKKMIAASRAKMLEACSGGRWADTLRACIIVGGEDTCFRSSGMALQWGYPAAGVVAKLGVPECDAYGAAVMKLAACDKIPQDSRDALVRSFEETRAHVAGLPAAERAKKAPSCAAGLEAINEVAASAGC